MLPGRNFITTLFFIFDLIAAAAQTSVMGTVKNSNKEVLSGATVHVKGSDRGVYADSTGSFLLSLSGKGKRILKISSVGYQSSELKVELNDSNIRLDITLKDSAQTLGDVVVISVGSFDASDKAKGAALTPIDAVTVAGNGGDIANALRFLPGAQQIGEQDGLFV